MANTSPPPSDVNVLCADAGLSHPHNCRTTQLNTRHPKTTRYITQPFFHRGKKRQYTTAAVMQALYCAVFGVSPPARLDGNATPVKNASAVGAKHAQTATSPPITRPIGAIVSDNLYPPLGFFLLLLFWLRHGSMGIAGER